MKFITNLLNTFISLIKILIKSKFNLSKNKINFENLIIIGNGPSANKFLESNYQRPKSTSLMCVNMFATSSAFNTLKPEFYLLMDSAFFDIDEISFENPEKHSKIDKNPNYLQTLNQVINTWNNLNKVDWEINIFIPQIYFNSYAIKKVENKLIKFIEFNYTVVQGFENFENWIYNRGWGSPQCQNVINACIFQATNTGVKNIYLIGVDNNFHLNLQVSEKNEVYVVDDHFYKVEQKIVPLIRPTKSGGQENVKMHELFLSLHKAFKSYHRLARYSKYKKINIFNSTEGSFIDAFERSELPTH